MRPMLNVALLTAALWTAHPAAAVRALMVAPDANDRVLIIAPHPDDESLCCAGLIRQALNAGASVSIVWVTAGDGFELDALVVERTLSPGSAAMQRLGKQRLREAHAAAAALGVPPAGQYVRGYPDPGIAALIGPYYQRPYRSQYTASTSVRYADAVSPGASYTGANLERDLEYLIAEFRPTLVLAAAPQDLHPDHRASGELVRRLLERRGELAALRYWIIHARGWPRPYGLEPPVPLAPPAIAASL